MRDLIEYAAVTVIGAAVVGLLAFFIVRAVKQMGAF